jgi:hypothetical protein
MLSLRSSSLLDGYPSHAVLYTEESATAANNKGCVYLRSTNTVPSGPTNYTLGQEWHTALYPAAPNVVSYMKMLPHMRTTDGTLGRMNTPALRAMAAAGSRRMLEVGDELLLPNKDGVPLRWNKKYNENDTDTADILRIWHTGSPSPLGLPAITEGTINAAGTWHEGDSFYISVSYKMADGSVTMPIIPRDRNDDINLDWGGLGNMSGFGKVALERSGVPSNDRYLYLTWSRIPIGPQGTVGRFLLRTPKLSGSATEAGVATTVGTEPSQLDLRIVDYLPNNTQTSYQDANGNDLSLQTDPLLIRFDHIMPPPARYISTFDGRILVGYTKPNPVAFYLCPDLNVTDNDATIDDTIYEYTLASGVLTLKKASSAGTAITCDNTVTIQQVVDRINNTASAGSGGKWWAAVAPGADSSALCSSSAAANNNLTSLTGMTFGDDNYAADRMRCYGSSYPGCVFYSTTYLANYPTQKRRLAFTMGGPGMPDSAANSWAAGNIRTAPESWGDYMGAAPLKSGAVICFSKAIGTLENRKGGNTGIDEDYRRYDLNPGRGCIAWDSIAEFSGAVGYLTRDGYVVTDGRDEVIISGDVWNPGTQTGEWAYEIAQCGLSADGDTDSAHFHAKVMGGRLYTTSRLTSGAPSFIPERMLVYDFTGSAQYSGLRGVLRPDGTPWGWSTPLHVDVSVMGEVQTSAGLVRLGTKENNAGASSNGRIEQFETGTADNSVAISSQLWTVRDLADHMKKKAVQELSLVYRKSGTGLSLSGFRDGTGTASDVALTIPSSGTNFDTLPLPMPQNMRSATRSLEVQIADTGASADAPQIWGIEADVLLLDSYT